MVELFFVILAVTAVACCAGIALLFGRGVRPALLAVIAVCLAAIGGYTLFVG